MRMPARISPTTAGILTRSASSAATLAASRTTRMSTRTSVTLTPVPALVGPEQVAASVHRADLDAGVGDQPAQAREVHVEDVAILGLLVGPAPAQQRLAADDGVAALEQRRRRAGPGSAAAPRRDAPTRSTPSSSTSSAAWLAARSRSVWRRIRTSSSSTGVRSQSSSQSSVVGGGPCSTTTSRGSRRARSRSSRSASAGQCTSATSTTGRHGTGGAVSGPFRRRERRRARAIRNPVRSRTPPVHGPVTQPAKRPSPQMSDVVHPPRGVDAREEGLMLRSKRRLVGRRAAGAPDRHAHDGHGLGGRRPVDQRSGQGEPRRRPTWGSHSTSCGSSSAPCS